jgi:hypothetical protein
MTSSTSSAVTSRGPVMCGSFSSSRTIRPMYIGSPNRREAALIIIQRPIGLQKKLRRKAITREVAIVTVSLLVPLAPTAALPIMG